MHAIAPPIDELVDLRQQLLDDVDLAGDLGMPLIQRIKEALGADNFALRKIDREAEVGQNPIRCAGLMSIWFTEELHPYYRKGVRIKRILGR